MDFHVTINGTDDKPFVVVLTMPKPLGVRTRSSDGIAVQLATTGYRIQNTVYLARVSMEEGKYVYNIFTIYIIYILYI